MRPEELDESVSLLNDGPTELTVVAPHERYDLMVGDPAVFYRLDDDLYVVESVGKLDLFEQPHDGDMLFTRDEMLSIFDVVRH